MRSQPALFEQLSAELCQISSKSSQAFASIENDVHRTFVTHPAFGGVRSPSQGGTPERHRYQDYTPSVLLAPLLVLLLLPLVSCVWLLGSFCCCCLWYPLLRLAPLLVLLLLVSSIASGSSARSAAASGTACSTTADSAHSFCCCLWQCCFYPLYSSSPCLQCQGH